MGSPPSGEDLLSIEEVAEQLQKSVATIRRWCSTGRLPARKTGRQWVIRRADVPARRTGTGVRPSARLFDVDQALSHIARTDLSELWVPDILRWEDHLQQPDGVKDRARARLDGAAPFDAVTDVDVPKSSFFSRNASLLSIEDHLAYQAAVGSIAARIDNSLSSAVYSARVSRTSRFFLQKGTAAWVRYKRDTIDQVKQGRPWVVKTDVTAYFDNIQHSILFRELDALSSRPEPVSAIKRGLSAWTPVPGVGVPQGQNASRVLGNLYLAAVDREMLAGPWWYARFQDDIRIVASSRHEALEGLRVLERECRSRGLNLSVPKTKLLHGLDEVRDDFEDAELDAIAYEWGIGARALTRKRLRRILKESIRTSGEVHARRGRFALWRLTLLRDGSQVHRVLDNLHGLGPIASLAVQYLRPFMMRPRVQEKLTAFLLDKERNVFPLISTWVLAGMLDYAAPLPVGWLNYARSITYDRNAPAYHRAIACNVLLRGRDSRDIRWVEQEIRRERDPQMLRAYLVAMARIGLLNKGVYRPVIARNPELEVTAQYLQGRDTLPSLLFSQQRTAVPSR